MSAKQNQQLVNDKGEPLRKCSACKCVKLLNQFFSVNVKGDYKKTCDKCLERHRAKNKKHYENNKEKIKQRKKAYYENNKDQKKEYGKQYYENNKDQRKQYGKQYYNKLGIKERKCQYQKQYITDKRHYCEHLHSKHTCKICSPLTHLKATVAGRVYQALKSIKKNKDNRTLEYLNCDINTFKNWIERQFTSEMNWDNIGTVWQIDHIVPILYKINGQSPRECDVIRRLHYMNTQPMLSWQNMSKGNRYIGGYKPDF